MGGKFFVTFIVGSGARVSVSLQKIVPPEQRRSSPRLASKPKAAAVEKKKAVTKRVPKAKKAKPAENGNTKAEEPKAEATEAK